MLQCRPLPVQNTPMLELGLKFLLSYGLGSIMGAMVAGALKGGVDIRTMGSGNAGGTNALRTQGWMFALGVIVVDIGKGALGAGVVPGLALPIPADEIAPSAELLTYSCAAATVIGHVWPIWHRFRGGKGAATLIGTLLVLAPIVLLPILAAWLVLVTLFGYVGLATMTGGVVGALFVGATRLPEEFGLFAYVVFCAAFMIYTHRSNIERMRAGNENRNTRLMIFRRSSV